MPKTDEVKTEKVEKVYSEGVLSAKKIKTDLRKKEPPLVDIKITNPITYLKSWWNKIIGNEGVDFRLKVRPITAIALTVIIITVSLGIGRFVLPFKIPFFEYTSEDAAALNPTGAPYMETAFTGILHRTLVTNRYYLVTATSEAITLDVPTSIELKDLAGKRIFASGKYYISTNTIVVDSAQDLEILPDEITPVVTSTPVPTAIPTEIPAPIHELTAPAEQSY
jgi:hypothetical protein